MVRRRCAGLLQTIDERVHELVLYVCLFSGGPRAEPVSLVQAALAEGLSLPAVVDARTYVLPRAVVLLYSWPEADVKAFHSTMAQQARDLQILEESLQSVVYLHGHLVRAYEYEVSLVRLGDENHY